jgi:hypothetical protein
MEPRHQIGITMTLSTENQLSEVKLFESVLGTIAPPINQPSAAERACHAVPVIRLVGEINSLPVMPPCMQVQPAVETAPPG